MSTIIISNLPPPPVKIPLYRDNRNDIMSTEWERWFYNLRDRVGGASGSIIYDNANSSQLTSSLEPQLFAIKADIENQLTGILLTLIEQVQEQTFDPSALLNENIAGFIQQAIDTSPVQSVFGRVGAVTSQDGDYSLNLLGDVILTAPALNQVLQFDGVNWINATLSAGSITGTIAVANGGTGLTTLTANAVMLGNGASSPTFVSPGTTGNVLTSNGTTWVSSAPSLAASAPNYEEAVATAGQTVVNTTVNTTAKAAGKSYLQIFVNGVFQQEGATKQFTVTGANQVTFNTGLALNDDLVIYSWT